MKYLLFVLLFISCNSYSEEKSIKLDEFECDTYTPLADEYSSEEVLHFKIRLLVYGGIILSEDQIEQNLNKRFHFGNIQFKVGVPINIAEKIPDSFRTLHTKNYNPSYITIVVVPKDTKFLEEVGKTVAGAADGVPGYPNIDNVATAKPTIMIKEEMVYTDILIHEVGHVFGLLHTFQDYDYDNNGLNCDSGDFISTTITPDPDGEVLMESCDYKSNKYTKKTDKDNIVQNPMSYSPHYCLKDFNTQQFQRMRKIASKSPRLIDCIYKITLEK